MPKTKKAVSKAEPSAKVVKVCVLACFIHLSLCVFEHECVQNPKWPQHAALGKERLCMDWYPCSDRNGSFGNIVISWLHMQCLYQGL